MPKVAGLPEPSQHKPSDTIPFLYPEKDLVANTNTAHRLLTAERCIDMRFGLFVLLLFLATNVFAVHVAVLETGADGNVQETVSLTDRQFLTNVLREQAVNELPAVQNYTIMTRENINAMLPPGKSIEDCEGTCLAETGRNISADFICQARVGSFGESLTLSAELYETAGNKLIASFNGLGNNVADLLRIIKEKSPEFFRSVKDKKIGFIGTGGIGAIGAASSFSYMGRKNFIVEITSNPVGAIPTVDGRAIPKCTSTPCKVQLEEGSHRIVASMEHYDDAEIMADIKANDQQIALNLSPAFGWLDIKPALGGGVSQKGTLNVSVDGIQKETVMWLEPGPHSVRITHPCYDPVEFNVVIEKNKKEIFDKEMVRGKGALELSAEYNGEPQAVAVYIDGVESGSTPYSGEIPLCAEISLKGDNWTEDVDVALRWHEVVRMTHVLEHKPTKVAMMTHNDSTRMRANEMYAELEGDEPKIETGIPTNKNQKSNIHWLPISISALVSATGVVLAVAGNNQAKNAHEKGFSSESEYKKNKDNAHNGQVLRGVGIGLAIAGAVGLGFSIAF